jgi:hypothetical protein
MKTPKSKIETAASVLKGKSLSQCRRAANMAMFNFGEGLGVRDPSTTTGDRITQVALHVQCAWRISRFDRVLVASRDLQYPADYREGESVPGDFDWDRDPNRLDKLIEILFCDDATKFVVTDVSVGKAGSLRIVLSDDLCLEVFPDDSLPLEHWRLFSPGTNAPHLVVTGNEMQQTEER